MEEEEEEDMCLAPGVDERRGECAGESGDRDRLIIAEPAAGHRRAGGGQALASAAGHHRVHSPACQPAGSRVLRREAGPSMHEMAPGSGVPAMPIRNMQENLSRPFSILQETRERLSCPFSILPMTTDTSHPPSPLCILCMTRSNNPAPSQFSL